MRGKFLTAVCVILLLIPTYLAVFYYINAQDAPVSVSVVSKMSIVDYVGNVFEFDRTSKKLDDSLNNISDNMIEFFMTMNENSKETLSLPDPLKGNETFTVTFYNYNRESVYKYYFSSNTAEAYYSDNNGVTYRISEKHAGIFLLSEYARGLYPSSQQPIFTLSDTAVIDPQKLTWEYLNYTDQYTVATAIDDITTAIGTYDIMGGMLNFDFSVEPDYLYVTITENGVDMFNGSYEELGVINLNEDTMIKIYVEARWYDSPERGAKGEAIYNFYGNVKAQPAFSLGKNIIEPGEFVVLTGQNVVNVNDITFTSEPSINYTPVFFEDESYVRALIPISYDLPEILEMSGDSLEYKLKITVYGNTYELILNVQAKEFRSQPYSVSESVATKRTESTINEFNVAMARIYSSQEPTRYWESGKFGFPIPSETVSTGFGVTRNVRYEGSSTTIMSYRHDGTDFLINYGTPDVCAINAGKVIYVGEQVLSGKIIVIDHGWGLKSTYSHLSVISVSEGDIVNKGDVIGVTGTTGFTNGTNIHLGLHVFDVPVSPYPLLWNDPEGIPMLE